MLLTLIVFLLNLRNIIVTILLKYIDYILFLIYFIERNCIYINAIFIKYYNT